MTARGAYIAVAGILAVMLTAAHLPIVGIALALLAGLIEPHILED